MKVNIEFYTQENEQGFKLFCPNGNTIFIPNAFVDCISIKRVIDTLLDEEKYHNYLISGRA